MSSRKNQPALWFIAALTILAAWLILRRDDSFASNFVERRRSDVQETAAFQKAFEDIVARRDVQMPLEKQKEIAKLFHDLSIWQNMWFQGIAIQKNPCDLWMMQQIIYETKPDIIVETGTYRGGSALYFAHTLEGIGLTNSQVITVDIADICQKAAESPLWKKHVQFIQGSSTDPAVAEQIRQKCRNRRVLVVLDSVHEMDHVVKELELYAPLVSVGSYLVVEDTNSDGVPVFPGSVGPTAALQVFLPTPEGRHFTQDASREAMVLTFNPGGWLKREN